MSIAVSKVTNRYYKNGVYSMTKIIIDCAAEISAEKEMLKKAGYLA